MSDEQLKAISPWAEVDTSEYRGLSPRLDDLNGKTIGMYGDFMIVSTYLLHAVEKELKKHYPEAKFSYIQYTKETTRIAGDEGFKPQFDAWADGVDCILSFYGTVPSGALFLGYNSAYMERLGKPTVMLVIPRTYPAAARGAKAGGVPALRTLQYAAKVDTISGHVTQEAVDRALTEDIAELTDGVVDALTRPLSHDETDPVIPDQEYARTVYTGSAREISRAFYKKGWTNGTPIDIPTRDAVDEMVRGAGLPADYIVGHIPPKMGCATVERIAVNAVMAGCLPTYMPVLIAAVRGALDPVVSLEGWSCSQSTWGPTLTVSGRVAHDINLNTKDHFLSPYYKPNACIARAFGYIMMNIGGLRPTVEDLSEMGHEFRMGFCMGDDPDNNPWQPLHMDFGMDREDSAVTLFWPQEHRVATCFTVEKALSWLCTIDPYGWDPGMAVIFSPICARMMADAGWTKERILSYVVEYGRKPASQVDLQWLVGNNHPPKTVDLPVNMEHSTRNFWSAEHMFVLVGGGKAGPMVTVLGGGGDHGGPSCTKIGLPGNWDELVREYADIVPGYVDY